eukprot:Gb_30474 [translate_table: standard]
MRNAGNKLQGRGQRSSRSGSFFPSSLRAISSYLKSATSVASTIRSAGASVASSISLPEDDAHRDQVQWAGFDKLELGANIVRHVLLLSYMNGFQVWDVEEADDVRELISKQDGPVAFLQMQPRPITSEPEDEGFKDARPLLLVVTGDGTLNGGNVQGGFGSGYGVGVGSPPQSGSGNFLPTVVRFYSLRSHTYVHVLRFRSAVYAVRCSPRIIAVALAAQIYCFDAATLQNTFSVLTYPIPQGGQGPGGINIGYGPLAVGTRWLAYAANHALVSNTGRASPQHLTPSPGVSPSTSPANGNLVAHYAKESSKQIAAGIVTLGDIGYKTFTKYYAELLPDGTNSPKSGSPSWKSNSNGLIGHACEPENAGMVIVRDFVSKSVVAQFRAHTSPLSALCFDPSGTLLVTASVHGHNLNVYRIMPSLVGNGSSSAGFDMNVSYVHLYKLYRGLTNAVIQDICFSDNSHWIAISSSRGTSHLFAISPFGGVVGTHDGTLVDSSLGSAVLPSPTIHWLSSPGPLKVNQQPLPPPSPPITLSVVSRIKNGNGGWRGTVSGAAAAATGRTNSPTGAVAAVFHNSGGHSLQSDLRSFNYKDQLWVFSPSGHVIQYSLCLCTGAETVYSSNSASGMGCGSSEPSQDLRVVVETIQKWDVCQKPNRVEREENIDSFYGCGTVIGEMGKRGLGGYRNGTVFAHPVDTQRVGKEGVSSDEKHHWYLSNAEVQMHQARTPIWAKSEIYFQVMMCDNLIMGNFDKDATSGEIEIERIPTRVVEVRTNDLVPVFDHLQGFKEVQGARTPVPRNVPGTSAMQIHQLKDDCMQDGTIGMNIGFGQMQRSSSGSSCGSLSGFPGGQSMIVNGFYHAYQDSQEHMGGVFYSNSSTSFGHPSSTPTTSEQVVLLESLENLKVTNLDSNAKSTCEVANAITSGPPPMDIPRWSRGGGCNTQGLPNSFRMNSGSRSLPMNDCGFSKKHAIKHDANAGVILEGHVMTGLICSKQGLSYSDNSLFSGQSLCRVGVEQETGHVMGISTQCLHEEPMHYMDLAVESGHVGIRLHDEDSAIEDANNMDLHTKTGDPEKATHDEDGWEGGMFPFCVEE